MGRPRVVEKVAEIVMRKLADGQWSPPKAFPSVRDVAATCGVAHRTAMAAVQHLARHGIVQVEQRKRVVVSPDAVEKARVLLSGGPDNQTTHRLAILYPESLMPPSRNAFYSALIRAVIQEAATQNTDVEVVPWSVQHQMALAGSLVHRGFDRALVLSYYPMLAAALFAMHECGLPFIVFNHRVAAGMPLPTVVFDRHKASHMMAERLVALGHRNICLMVHPHEYMEENAADNTGRASSWVLFLKEKGLLDACSMPLYVPWETLLGLYSPAFRAVMKGPDRPTAIVFGFSPWAKRFLNDPEFSHMGVPQDLSLATFETTADLPQAPGRPPLTSFEINLTRTAQCIMETLGRVAAGDTNVPTIRVPLDLRLTDSIGPAPETGNARP